jgi:hypothetical protein
LMRGFPLRRSWEPGARVMEPELEAEPALARVRAPVGTETEPVLRKEPVPAKVPKPESWAELVKGAVPVRVPPARVRRRVTVSPAPDWVRIPPVWMARLAAVRDLVGETVRFWKKPEVPTVRGSGESPTESEPAVQLKPAVEPVSEPTESEPPERLTELRRTPSGEGASLRASVTVTDPPEMLRVPVPPAMENEVGSSMSPRSSAPLTVRLPAPLML